MEEKAMTYTVVTMDRCSSCVAAKQLLSVCGIEYKEVDMFEGDGIETVRHLVKEAGSVPFRSLPQIFVHNEDGVTHIGGTDELKQYLKENEEGK